MAPCVVCGTGTGRVCEDCLTRVRGDIATIARLWMLLPLLMARPDGASLGAVMGGRSDEAALPGGDLLVMVGPGSDSGAGWASDPPAVGHELWVWVVDWHELRVERVPARPWPTLDSARWLVRRLRWAGGEHPAFDDFAGDMDRIASRMELATHSSPRAEPVPGHSCPMCGSAIVREWTVHGLADDWSCPRCRRSFTIEEYMRLARIATAGLS